MKKVQAYLTSDGSLFDNEDGAIAYESSLETKLLIPEFLESSYNTYKKAISHKIITYSIVSWESFKKAKGIEL